MDEMVEIQNHHFLALLTFNAHCPRVISPHFAVKTTLKDNRFFPDGNLPTVHINYTSITLFKLFMLHILRNNLTVSKSGTTKAVV